jgi:YD repeat-containing protein
MKAIVAVPVLFLSSLLHAQYYYNDIIGTRESNRQMQVYTANKVKTVSARGIDAANRPANEFSEFQEIKDNGTTLKITAFANQNKSVYYNRFDARGRLISITDSSGDQQSETTYQYDEAGKILKVQNTTKDTGNAFNQTEIHQWIYGNDGKPVKMWRTINNGDSLEVRFIADEDGNPGEERSFKKGHETAAVYYYYDDKDRLSDIVRYNTKVKKLLPDIMFEYDDQDRVIQRITTTSSLNLGYLIWRYLYDEKGLKTKEALFNNDKELNGRIEFTYTFWQ